MDKKELRLRIRDGLLDPDIFFEASGSGSLAVMIDDVLESKKLGVLVKPDSVKRLIDFLKLHYPEMMK